LAFLNSADFEKLMAGVSRKQFQKQKAASSGGRTPIALPEPHPSDFSLSLSLSFSLPQMGKGG
jgi:hypothetical protein